MTSPDMGEERTLSDLDLGFLGLPPFGVHCYEQVALHPYSSTQAIASRLGVDVAEVDAELRSQAERGQVRLVGGAWIAEDLTAWLDAVHAREQAEQATAAAERARQRADLLRSHLPAVHRHGTRRLVAAEGTETINLTDVDARIVELAECATRSLRFMIASQGDFEEHATVAEAMVSAARRGLRLSSVWAPECIEAARLSSPAGRLPPLGWVRSNPDVPYRAILADDEAVLVQRDQDDLQQGALVIVHPPTVALYANLIDGLYASGQHLVTPEPPAALDHRHRHDDNLILALIARGETNKVIGVQIGYSERTVQRRVSELMERYGARSRVELVAKAADLLPPTQSAS
jgi:hypothetical protein